MKTKRYLASLPPFEEISQVIQRSSLFSEDISVASSIQRMMMENDENKEP
jgi:hypothetical protein